VACFWLKVRTMTGKATLPAPARLGLLFVLTAATLGATGPACNTSAPAGESGSAPGAADDASSGIDGASLPPMSDAAGHPGDAGSSHDDASSSPGDASGDASAAISEAGPFLTADAGGDAAPSAPPTWATWPMPNAPSSGLSNPQSYDTSVAGIALDRVTGLTWQRDYDEVTTQQDADASVVTSAAGAYCTGLALGGYHDWRVPTRIELVSLLDFTTAPAANSTVFTPTTDTFVSSSVHPSIGIGTTWQASDTSGVLGGVVYLAPFMGMLDNSGPIAVRCVRGGAAPTGEHYAIASGTVHDEWTGLTWIQAPSSSVMLESTVSSYCASQTIAGGGWRAPSVNELETLWGDFYTPDDVSMDSTTFTGPVKLGSLDYSAGSATSGNLWFVVGGAASTGVQADVTSVLPIVGVEPAQEYWTYAQCVR
jgi:hypothetical protein